eukprot:766690-Hanusia_phi.AAC.3
MNAGAGEQDGAGDGRRRTIARRRRRRFEMREAKDERPIKHWDPRVVNVERCGQARAGRREGCE